MDKKRLDIMVDIETLGTKTTSTIIQIASIAFDINTEDIKYTFNESANISNNKETLVTGNTLKWWLETNPKLLLDIISRQDQTSDTVVRKFYNWLNILKEHHDIYLWSNGILFDAALIKTQIENQGLDYPIFYRNDRDVRTIVDLAGSKLGISEQELKDKFKDGSLVAHDGFDDCKYQIGLVSGCYNILIKEETDE